MSPTAETGDTGSTIDRRDLLATASALIAGTVGVAGTASASEDRPYGPRRNRDDYSVPNQRSPTVIAHRGFAGLNPENTVGACVAASRGGRSDTASSRSAEVIEIDVMATADGDVVVFHDDGLSERDGGERGLTDTTGNVWETDTETVTSAEVLDSGETVPLLEEVVQAIPTHIGVNVELKHPGSPDLRFADRLTGDALATQTAIWRPFVERVLSIVDRHRNPIIFSSFYQGALAATRELSTYAVAPLCWDSIEDGLAIAREYDAEAIHPPYNMIAGTPFYRDEYYTEGSDWADIDLLATAHDEGRDVNVYTLQSWFEAEQLAAAGVDGLIMDFPDLLQFGATHGD